MLSSIVISGGAGFLGSHLSEAFIQQGYRVYCLDNFSTSMSDNIRSLLEDKNFRLQPFDVTHPRVQGLECDLVLHFAGRAAPDEYQTKPVETISVNSEGTKSLLDLALTNHAPFVYASTSEVYGDATVIPTPETYWGNVSSTGVRSCYDEAKRYGEALCMAYNREYDLDTRIVRIFNTYGPRLRADGLYGRALSRFIMQALHNQPLTIYGDGTQTRSFCYVTDTIQAILQVCRLTSMKGEVVNVGNPTEVTINHVANMIVSLTNSQSKIQNLPPSKDDPKRRCPDISKASRLLNWKPHITLEEGLEKTISWVKSIYT